MICDRCGKAEFAVVEGWESRKALKCPACGHYHYFVGSIHCCLMVTSVERMDEIEAEARRALGVATDGKA